MYWRRRALFIAIIFGTTLWISPFSALAFDFCVSETNGITPTTCPAGSSFVKSTCLTGLVSGAPEHTCASSIDPCIHQNGGDCAGSCGFGTFRVNSCSNLGDVTHPSCTDDWCVTTTTFQPKADSAATGGGGTPVTGTPATGTPPVDCTATPTAPGCKTITVGNPLSFSTVEGVLGSLLGALQGIIVVLSLVFIVIGAVLYITSAGNDGRMKVAKGAITASMIGLALGLAAPSFLKQISTILGWTAVTDCTAGTPPPTAADIAACQTAQATLNAGKSLSEIATNVLQFLLSIVGVLGIIMLVIGGIMYLTAAGDEDRIDTGKSIVKYAIIGIAVALAALVVVTQLANFFA